MHYLGHSKLRDTYWYLTGVPELLRRAAATFENPQPRPPANTLYCPQEGFCEQLNSYS